jgi:hypothetical protein
MHLNIRCMRWHLILRVREACPRGGKSMIWRRRTKPEEMALAAALAGVQQERLAIITNTVTQMSFVQGASETLPQRAAVEVTEFDSKLMRQMGIRLD